METSVPDERQALLDQGDRELTRSSKSCQQQQRQPVKMNGEDKHLVGDSHDETLSVGKFTVSGGAVMDRDEGTVTPGQLGSPHQGQGEELHSGFDNSILLPQLEIAIYLRDQTVIHVTMEEGQQARAEDLIEVVLTEQKLPPEARTMFCLWLVSPLLELRLKPHHKPFFLVSQWADLCDKYTEEDADDIAKDEPMLMFQRDVFFPRQQEAQVRDRETLLYLYQEAKFNVLEGRYVVSPEDYHRLAGISAVIHLGRFDRKSHISAFYRSSLEQFYPDFMLKKKWSFSGLWSKNSDDGLSSHLEAAHTRVSDQYQSGELHQVLPELYRAYLNILYKYPFYGGAFFTGDIDRTSRLQFLKGFQDKPVWISISTDGVTVIDREKNEVLLALPYETFSWQYKEAKKVDDPPILYLQFVCPESAHNTKLLIVDSYQAKLMDALIETCVNLKIQKYNTPAEDTVDSTLPSPSSENTIGMVIRSVLLHSHHFPTSIPVLSEFVRVKCASAIVLLSEFVTCMKIP
ncbi:putative FERM domain-containing protein FRMD8P1 isoform X2 [Liolophura sinensis]|uniref:putative FERM domain-containing protein FRMD8P1 isoform X2 n=2 Tax=Liolophura sinensis TaxID=3198878 RepID=UPI003158A67B